MPFSNEQKLAFIKKVFIRKIQDVPTLGDMVNLIQNISPGAVKAFLIANLDEIKLSYTIETNEATSNATDIESLKVQVDGL